MQTLGKSKGFPVGDLVLRWLSWDIASLHHPLTTLMAWSPGQILPVAVESWLMGCAGLGERARQFISNCFKKQRRPRLTRCTVVWRQQETRVGKQLASSKPGSMVEQARGKQRQQVPLHMLPHGQWSGLLAGQEKPLVMAPMLVRAPLPLPALTSGETPPKQTGC